MANTILSNLKQASAKQLLGIYAHCAAIAAAQIEGASAAQIEQAICSLKGYLAGQNLQPSHAAQWLKQQKQGNKYLAAQYAGFAISQWQQGKGAIYFYGI